MMKQIKVLLIMIIICICFVFANNLYEESDSILSFANEYNQDNEFDLNKVPNRFFYKLSSLSKYYINDKNNILSVYQNDKGGIVINYNKQSIDLTYDNGSAYTSKDTSVYILKAENIFYLFVDKMHFNDNKSYSVYKLSEKGIDLILAESGRISFVGYDYIIGYKYLGIIGYQKSEFKKVFNDNKFELDGEYKIIGTDEGYPKFPIWKFYTLVKDLKYEECDSTTNEHKEVLLEAGTKIRALSTDAKTYINIEVEDGKKGKVKVDKVDDDTRDFYVNGKLFMNYYFLDGSKDSIEVFCPMFPY